MEVNKERMRRRLLAKSSTNFWLGFVYPLLKVLDKRGIKMGETCFQLENNFIKLDMKVILHLLAEKDLHKKLFSPT